MERKTGDLSTSENQVFLAFSNRLDPRVGIGVAVKLYHSKLYTRSLQRQWVLISDSAPGYR